MATRELLILSATEPDRPGLVTELAGYIAEHGCNVDDSRVSVLGGYAGLMFLVAGEPAQITTVLDSLPAFRERTGIRTVARRLSGEPANAAAAGTARYIIRGSAIDHTGIIFNITEAVRAHGGNILELETATESAPMSGSPLFIMEMIFTLPDQGGAAKRLEAALETMARTQSVDIEMDAAAPARRGEAAGAAKGTG